MQNVPVLLALALASPSALRPTPVPGAERILRFEVVVEAPIETVWKLWATAEGVTSFFAPAANVEPRVDGPYEMWFNPRGEPGKKGGEGNRILAFEPPKRLAFTWNAPPSQPYARGQRTVVDVRLAPEGDGKTRLVFTHAGWGEGPEWDAAYAYFDRAWSTFVLPHFVHRAAKGPIDWANPPKVDAVAPTLRMDLVPKAR